MPFIIDDIIIGAALAAGAGGFSWLVKSSNDVAEDGGGQHRPAISPSRLIVPPMPPAPQQPPQMGYPPSPQSYGTAPMGHYGQSPEVSLQKERDGHFYATGQLETLSIRMLVDTGATSCAFGDETMSWLDVGHTTPSRVTLGDGKTINVRQFVLPYLTVGGVTVHNVTCSHIPGRNGDILGMSFLGQCDVSISGDTMIIRG